MVNITTSDSFSGGSTEGVAKLGKFMYEELARRQEQGDFYSVEDAQKSTEVFKNIDGRLQAEAARQGIAQEDLTSDNNTGIYTTVMADFIERALRPDLVALNVIKRLRISNRGTSGIKIPVSTLVSAAALPDSGAVTYATSADYTSVTVTLGWVYAAQKITMELIEQGNVDLIQDQLIELGYAVARKVDSDIIAAMLAATPNTDANSNYLGLGASTDISYAKLIEGIADANANYANVDTVIMSWTQWQAFMQDTDVKTALGFNSATPGTIFPSVINFAGLRLIANNQVDADDIYLVDTKRNGYYVEASDTKVFNDRVSGSLAQEVIVAKNYGVSIVQPATVYRIEANSA